MKSFDLSARIALLLSMVVHLPAIILSLLYSPVERPPARVYNQGPIEIDLHISTPVSKISKTKEHVHIRESSLEAVQSDAPTPSNEHNAKHEHKHEHEHQHEHEHKHEHGPTHERNTASIRQSSVYEENLVDIPARILSQPRIRYPKRALRDGIEGKVVLSLIVNEKGRVSEAKVVESGGYGFDEAALQASKSLKFSPAHKGEDHVAVRLNWTCRFEIHD